VRGFEDGERRRATNLLRVLSDHEHEGEVVHAQREVEELVGITEEDDVLDGVLRPRRVLGLELHEDLERRFVILRLLPHVRSEDRVGVVKDVALLEFGADEVANEVALVGCVAVEVGGHQLG
jgi:hypothetical protein